jgi:hypothetical protein
LPPHTIESIREAMEYPKMSGHPNPMGLLFPSRVGTVRNPNNFGRIWRAARGDTFAWITPDADTCHVRPGDVPTRPRCGAKNRAELSTSNQGTW